MSVLKQYHYLYKITNLINNKIYIGIHSTNKLDDGYFGSGNTLKNAFIKHDKKNFRKEILEWFDWRCEALQREAEIVNMEFIDSDDNYNNICGGIGCNYWSELTRYKMSKSRIGMKHSKETRRKISESNIGKLRSIESNKQCSLTHTTNLALGKVKHARGMLGKTHSIESKELIGRHSAQRLGGLNPMSKPCAYKSVKFSCIDDMYKFAIENALIVCCKLTFVNRIKFSAIKDFMFI